MTRPVVAVIPFGASGGADPRAGAWARQMARRLVERFAQDPALELRPVFLVAMPTADEASGATGGTPGAGYLVLGSTPDPGLASQYGRSLGATYALTGTYRETASARSLEAALIDVERASVAASFERRMAAGELHLVEPALAGWLVSALGVRSSSDVTTPAAASEPAWDALLQGMDAEVDATLLRQSDVTRARASAETAAASYAEAIRADPSSSVIEDRILVMAATAIEQDEQRLVIGTLEALTEERPRSWRGHYMLGEVRRTAGDTSGAIVAFEHADALQPLRDRDALLLARLYAAAGAGKTAAARLRRIIQDSQDLEVVAGARRLRLGLLHPDREADLEEAGRIAIADERERFEDAADRLRRVLEAEPRLWEAHFGRGLLALQRGDAEAARVSFERARELNPASASLIEQLAKPDGQMG